MKKLLIIAGIIAILVTLVTIIPVAGAPNDSKPIYEAALIDVGSTPGTAFGEVTMWEDGKIKIELFDDGAPAGQTYNVRMDYGAPPLSNLRISLALGTMAMGEDGSSIKYFDVTQDVPILPGDMLLMPGFMVLKPQIGLPALPVAVTGLLVPSP